MAGRTQHLYWGPSKLVVVSVIPPSRGNVAVGHSRKLFFPQALVGLCFQCHVWNMMCDWTCCRCVFFCEF